MIEIRLIIFVLRFNQTIDSKFKCDDVKVFLWDIFFYVLIFHKTTSFMLYFQDCEDGTDETDCACKDALKVITIHFYSILSDFSVF